MTEPIRTYTVKEAAAALSVSKRTVENLLNRGHLKRVKIGRRTVIRETDLRKLLDRGGAA